MQATTVRLDDDVDVTALGARSGLLLCRDGVGVAGVGEAARIGLDRPGPGSGAMDALGALTGPDEVAQAGTGPVAFAALPFTPDRPGGLIVPEVVVGRGPQGRRWLTVVGDGRPDVDAVRRRVQEVLDGPVPEGPEPTAYEVRCGRPPEDWCRAVAAVRDRIRGGGLTKAVLARELIVATDRPVDPALLLDRLTTTFPAAFLFRVGGFLGASPELLVSRDGDVVRAHPLAGTAPRSSDPGADAALAAGLLASAKDRSEHQITVDRLLDRLLAFCSYVDAAPEPRIMSIANVHHLGTTIEGRLSSPPASVLELVAGVHPTPAVGGEPDDVALATIAELEGFDRGPYAGPVGWVDAAGNGSFAVAIRSAVVDGTTVRCFAGNGMVADSDPAAELAETRTKFQAVLGALLRP